MKQYHKHCSTFYRVSLYIKCRCVSIVYLQVYFNYEKKVENDVFHCRFTSFCCFYLFDVNIMYCQTRTTIVAKIVILVHYSRFSIKVLLMHLNIDNQRALKVKLLKFIHLYCKCCVYGNRMRFAETLHFRIFSLSFNIC